VGFQVTVELKGLSNTLRKLDSLDKRTRKSAVRKAVSAGGQELVKAVRSNAPRDTGLLRRKSTKKVKTYRGKVLAIMGAKRFKDPATHRNPAYYAHLVEDGTLPHLIPRGKFSGQSGVVVRQNIQHPGTPATHFMRRAARQANGAALRRFQSKLASDVALAAKT
jgi:HK97 gp10 family phage protein